MTADAGLRDCDCRGQVAAPLVQQPR